MALAINYPLRVISIMLFVAYRLSMYYKEPTTVIPIILLYFREDIIKLIILQIFL
jgi:hypothetical protein